MQDLINQIGPPIIAAAVPFIVAGLRRVIARLPKWLLPILAGAIGPALIQLTSAFSTLEMTGTEQALVGVAGVGLREIVDQVGKQLRKESTS